MRRIIGALGEHRDGLGLELDTANAISYPDESGLEKTGFASLLPNF